MEEKTCELCGVEVGGWGANVTDKNGTIRNICNNCYNDNIEQVSENIKLKAQIEGIMYALSECQRSEAEAIADTLIEKEAFKNVDFNKNKESKNEKI